MTDTNDTSAEIADVWRAYLEKGDYTKEVRQRQWFRLLPGHPRCKNCFAPFGGAGSIVARAVFSKRPSNLNPKLCNVCERFARNHEGGAEINNSLLFVDVRGSTTMAEELGTTEFSKLINRFYRTATNVMVNSDALIDKIIGDQASGMYTPGLAGLDYTQKALDAARKIMTDTGHNDSAGPWIPLGAGVHTGISYIGSVGSKDGPQDITVLGDAPNTAARLSSEAQIGEILITEETINRINLDRDAYERRELALKGKSELVSVFVIKDY
jgi:adenylate cyclase